MLAISVAIYLGGNSGLLGEAWWYGGGMTKFVPSLLCIVLVTACGPSNREQKLADEVLELKASDIQKEADRKITKAQQEADLRVAEQRADLQAERKTFAKNLAAAVKNANAWKDTFDESVKTNKALKAEFERLKLPEVNSKEAHITGTPPPPRFGKPK